MKNAMVHYWLLLALIHPTEVVNLLCFQKTRLLYIFAGQRLKEYLTDFLAYHVDEDRIEVISDGTGKDGGSQGKDHFGKELSF